MGFFSKDEKKEGKAKEGIGDNSGLPNLPSLPDLPAELPPQFSKGANKNTALPSFPNSKSADHFNRASIKDAVTHEKTTQEIPEIHTPAPRNPPRNLPPIISQPPTQLHEPRSLEMSEWEEPQHTAPSQPLFIKLDTFEKAVSSFNEIKLSVSEIESLLRNIRDIKNKEEAELSEWEREIETIKSRLEQINHDIFDKIE
jgi:hypothetical protein